MSATVIFINLLKSIGIALLGATIAFGVTFLRGLPIFNVKDAKRNFFDRLWS